MVRGPGFKVAALEPAAGATTLETTLSCADGSTGDLEHALNATHTTPAAKHFRNFSTTISSHSGQLLLTERPGRLGRLDRSNRCTLYSSHEN
jgi:hypothetical protein